MVNLPLCVLVTMNEKFLLTWTLFLAYNLLAAPSQKSKDIQSSFPVIHKVDNVGFLCKFK